MKLNPSRSLGLEPGSPPTCAAGEELVRAGDHTAQQKSTINEEVDVSHQERCFTLDLLSGDLLFCMQRGLLNSTKVLQAFDS